MSCRLRSLRIALSYITITTALVFLTSQAVAEPSGDPTLVTYPLSYEFTLTAGDSIVGESLYVYEAEGRAIDFWCYNYASWLQLDTVPAIPLITPKSIWVNIYTGGLAPGVYVDSIFLWSSEATNDPLVVPVFLTVEGSGDYEVRAEPDWMYATMASGEGMMDSLFVYEAFGAEIDFMFHNNQPWLEVDPYAMPPLDYVTPRSLPVLFKAYELAPGTYHDTIFISPLYGGDVFPEVAVPVTMTVYSGPELIAVPNRFEFNIAPGDNLTHQGFLVYEAHNDTLPFMAETHPGSSWLILEDSSYVGMTPDSVFFSVNATSLAPGMYVDSIIMYNPFDTIPYPPETVPIFLTVDSGGYYEIVAQPPYIEFHVPPDTMREDSLYLYEASGAHLLLNFNNMSNWLYLPYFFVAPETPTMLPFWISSEGLAPGLYIDSIFIVGYVDGPGPAVDTAAVPILMYVEEPSYQLMASPPGFDIVTGPDMVLPQTVAIWEASGGTLDLGLSNSSPWLQLPMLTVVPTTPCSLQFVIQTDSLPLGTYYDVIEVTGYIPGGGPPVTTLNIPVSLLVTLDTSVVILTDPVSPHWTLAVGEESWDSLIVYEQYGRNITFHESVTSEWLEIPPDWSIIHITPWSLPLHVDASGLVPGVTYVDTIHIFPDTDGVSFPPVYVIATLTVTEAETLVETIPEYLEFFSTSGALVLEQWLHVFEVHGQSVPFWIDKALGSPWLEVPWSDTTQPSWMTPDSVLVRVNEDTLPTGVYMDTLIIWDPIDCVFVYPAAKVPVTYYVGPTLPVVRTIPETLEYTVQQGWGVLDQEIYVYCETGDTLGYVAEMIDSCFWLQFTDSNWVHYTPSHVGFDIVPGNLPPGIYHDTMLIWHPWDDWPYFEDIRVPVTLTVLSDSMPFAVHTDPTEFNVTLDMGQWSFDSLFVFEELGRSVPIMGYSHSSWLYVPDPCTSYCFTPVTLPVVFATDSLPPGTYHDSIWIFPAVDSPLFVPVAVPATMTVREGGPSPGDSLFLPTITVSPCDDECVAQPVQVGLGQPIKGASIPLTVTPGVEVCSVSTTGLVTENWDYNLLNWDGDTVQIVLVNSFGATLDPGVTTVANIFFHITPPCLSPAIVKWDTTLSHDVSRRLSFSDTSYNVVYPGFDRERDVVILPGYEPGDFDNDGQLDIADLVALVDYMFLGGEPPCLVDAVDVNGDCHGPDIADLVCLVDGIFLINPPPELPYLRCGCITTSRLSATMVDPEVRVEVEVEDGATVITLSAPYDLRGVQFELAGKAMAAEPEQLIANGLEMIAGTAGNRMKVGVLDYDGANVIEAGTSRILRLDGEFQVLSAVVADGQYRAIAASIEASQTPLPEEFRLDQNYPNPFNPATEISFRLPAATDVTLEIYNITGRKVATLVEGNLPAGTHKVTWDASDHSSGVYFYRLTTPSFSDSRKMILLK